MMHTCFILQYVHYSPLHGSNITCSSSGGWNVLMQYPVSSSQSVVVRCAGWERTKHEINIVVFMTTWYHSIHCDLNKQQGCHTSKKKSLIHIQPTKKFLSATQSARTWDSHVPPGPTGIIQSVKCFHSLITADRLNKRQERWLGHAMVLVIAGLLSRWQ